MCRGTNATRSVINNQSICLRQQRVARRRLLITTCIPSYSPGSVRHRLIGGEGVELIVSGAGGHDVDCSGRREKRGVVPGEGDEVADLEVLSARDDGGGYHADAAGGEAVVKGCAVCGCAGFLGGRRAAGLFTGRGCA